MTISAKNFKKKYLDQLSIVTITFNDESLRDTFHSYKDLLMQGVQLIVINGGKSLDSWSNNLITKFNVNMVEEPDKGRYDALNKGIALVKTKYFMLVHGGDQLTIEIDEMNRLLVEMNEKSLDLVLEIKKLTFTDQIEIIL